MESGVGPDVSQQSYCYQCSKPHRYLWCVSHMVPSLAIHFFLWAHSVCSPSSTRGKETHWKCQGVALPAYYRSPCWPWTQWLPWWPQARTSNRWKTTPYCEIKPKIWLLHFSCTQRNSPIFPPEAWANWFLSSLQLLSYRTGHALTHSSCSQTKIQWETKVWG